ncbi:putative O-methyltransferase [Astrocystis sublimbata]|nr:putative O-methyltransferase [Astrocystis sublimbata]
MVKSTKNIRSMMNQLNVDKLSDSQRVQSIEAARKLISRLQTNGEKMHELTYVQPIVFAMLQAGLDVGLWAGWTQVGGDSKTVSELSQVCKREIEPELLRRMLRLLAAANIIEEVGEDTFKSTPFSFACGDSESFVPRTILCSTHHFLPAGISLPKYLAEIGYKNPRDSVKSNYVFWEPGHRDLFTRLMAEPEQQDSFSGWMRCWTDQKLPWVEYFDTNTLVEGADLSAAPLCIDVGGHHGIDLSRIVDKHPNIPNGSLVLQDLPKCLSEVKGLSEKIRMMDYDLFTPQPVKGARSYYLHCVIHDWSEDRARLILENTVNAMKKGYSKLLINEIVMPRTGASLTQTAMDTQLMALCSSYERTEPMWTSLLQAAGLKIVKIWPDGRGHESVIEAELA